jgi:hypothetical protein
MACIYLSRQPKASNRETQGLLVRVPRHRVPDELPELLFVAGLTAAFSRVIRRYPASSAVPFGYRAGTSRAGEGEDVSV